MNFNSKTSTRSLTLRYCFALGLIACVITASFLVLFLQVSQSGKSSYLVNISGMQRMLSQRIALMVREVSHADTFEQKKEYVEKMRGLTARMTANHNELVTGKLKEHSSYVLSPEIQNMYFSQDGVDQKVRAYTALAQEFLHDFDTNEMQEGLPSKTQEIVAMANDGLLKQLNDVVFKYQMEAEAKTNQIKYLETIVFIIGIFVLLGEVFWIFRPMVHQVSKNIDDLETANSELLEFSYRISHDLRAPIISSKGLIDVCESALKNDQKPILETSLGYIKTSMQKLETLIEDIINLTRINMTTSSVEDVSIKSIVEESLENLNQIKNYTAIDTKIQCDLNTSILTQRVLVQQSIDNLISNAIKYADIKKNAPFIHIHIYQKKAKCIVEITDNGLGIPKDYRDQMFGMFKRFHPKESFGSGLGLYLVKKNMKIIGGRVNYNALDKGSQFILTFPIVTKVEA